MKEYLEKECNKSNRCLICGKELPMDMTQIIITEGKNKYKSVCCSHEGSDRLKEIIGEV